MPNTTVRRHNYLGGPSGPPDIDTIPAYSPWIPIVDPEKVWATDSPHDVHCYRLSPEELRAVQELLGREPMGRHGNYPDGTDTFWSFGPRSELREAMNQLNLKLSEMHGLASPAIPALEQNKVGPIEGVGSRSLVSPHGDASREDLAPTAESVRPFLDISADFTDEAQEELRMLIQNWDKDYL